MPILRNAVLLISRASSVLARLAVVALVSGAVAACQPPPAAPPLRDIVFPVAASVSYTDTFGAARSGGRSHEGQDLMARKGTIAVAAVDGTVTWLRHDTSGLSGNMLRITDADGWQYVYIHLNNDQPGTDDGANRYDQAFADGIRVGQKVRAGEPVGYVGDSGNAENVGAHLHFELLTPDGAAVDAYSTLRAARTKVLTSADMATTRPRGNVDRIESTTPGTLTIAGWAVDRQVAGPSDVTLLVDGNPTLTFVADSFRPDVAAAFPGAGADHGFSRTVSGISRGLHLACVIAHNGGDGGGSSRLGCRGLAVY
jgi:hypothetical protein